MMQEAPPPPAAKRPDPTHLAQRLNQLLDNAPSPLFAVDERGQITYVNQAALGLLGFTRPALLGQSAHAQLMKAAQDGTPISWEESPIRQVLRGGQPLERLETVLWRKDRHPQPVHLSITPLRQGAGIGGAVIGFSDATEFRSLVTQLNYQASHDPLTGLLNRRELMFRLERAIHDARKHGHQHALIYLDLDQFRIINDTSGHEAGDDLLRRIGNLLGEHMRLGDSLARLGGDEFALLLQALPIEQAMARAESLREALQGFSFQWENRTFSLSASLGVVPVTSGSTSGIALMAAADIACNAAKDKGRNRVSIFRQNDTGLLRLQGDMQWVNRIQSAIKDSRLILFAQPIQALSTQKDHGTHFEVLMRLREDQDRLISPGNFLPAAERYNLATAIDRYVIRQCLAWLADQRPLLDLLDACAINLSGHSVGDAAFLDFVLEALEHTNIPPEKLCFEVTETVAIANLDNANDLFLRLSRLGCRFSLDDFGSGMSSFGYLRTLPVQYLKIDGIFVRDVVQDATDRALVSSINDIAHLMGKQTIAEYVESEAILKILRDIGVDHVQGHFIGEPRPLESLVLGR
ncbi:PAS/PAC sensor-containing diguanylate cyclase/phosphodiesterase [Ectothiorhodospira sp. PHS-1]|uniref:EAL domain-containing protein n=1 Tax=Ectothiorhodospira sp. PHS-1 TaxID=519989 RepID=UPI00024A8966|nr:EAL domain-containing protein [Ectothiorhodospira sp. PHS-1]EHQ51319.1 PAS/PAC sensor-containing diguanylate cyclase/phosphodiesterase [Ectothiorhodospira sp. PHS-1]